ncbi:MAG: DUF3037 domain-containing protein [Ktedonobacteraceae bacterium]
MHALASYDYAVVRVVPRVERGEFLNVGVILFCRTRRFLHTRIALDIHRLSIFASHLDLEEVQYHLDLLVRVSTGGKTAGPIGTLSQSERFHWLVSPRSTVIQTSPMHSGLCADPETALQALLEKMVHVTRP